MQKITSTLPPHARICPRQGSKSPAFAAAPRAKTREKTHSLHQASPRLAKYRPKRPLAPQITTSHELAPRSKPPFQAPFELATIDPWPGLIAMR